jgi:hypothetical protein
MKLPANPPRVFITHGSFRNRPADLLADYGSHARLAIPGMILNLPEWMFVRLASGITGMLEAVDYPPIGDNFISREWYPRKRLDA